MKGGYVGKLLFVDLTTGSIKEQELSESMAKDYLGGYGIGVRVLYDMMKPGVDPLGPENVLGFMTGPLTGTGAMFGGRYTVVCKSPVTGGWNDANSGGFFGPELKRAGFDGVFFTGMAKKPVYLWIKDGKAELRDAAKLWGKDSVEVEKALKTETGEDKMRAAVIGPAGEKLSLMACVMNDEHRAAGRGGCGAVMGSKKLKAIAVRGTTEIPVANPGRIKEINRSVTTAMKSGPAAAMMAGFGEYGTGSGTGLSALNGDSPVKNWGGVGVVDFGEAKANAVACPTYDAKYKVKKYSCSNCPLGCGARYKVDSGKWPIGETDRPEYETACSFGALCLNADIEAILKCNDICNRYGLDTISVGATVAWAMECYENKVFSKKDTDGIELTWGNAEAIVAMTQKIADSEGFGQILAMGSAAAAKKLGKGAQYLQTVAGIELPMHDPKLAPGFGRTYRFDATPARHVKGGLGLLQSGNPDPSKYGTKGTAFMDVMVTTNIEALNCAGLCMFGMFAAPPDSQTGYIEAATGWQFKGQDQLRVAMRVLTLKQAFNVREGIKPADTTISPRAVGEPPQQAGPNKGITIGHKELGHNFFTFMGWDDITGKPTVGALKALGLNDVVKDLHA